MNSIIIFNKTTELELTDEVANALALPDHDTFHPLSIPVEKLDPQFEYRWKAYAISENSKYETDAAQQQIVENLQLSINDGWIPVPALRYPFLLTPRIRKYSAGKFLRYNGLILCCKFKQFLLGQEPVYEHPKQDYISAGATKDVSVISFSTPLSIGKQINSCSL